jgi:hypothetical protein
VHHGYHTVGVGLKKAAKILDQQSVLAPRPENLFAVGRPIRDRATSNIDQAKTTIAEAQQILTSAPPFDPAGPHPNPWAARSAPRPGQPGIRRSISARRAACTGTRVHPLVVQALGRRRGRYRAVPPGCSRGCRHHHAQLALAFVRL